ncbi:peptidoglycan-binding domain-containing protein [Candidatus Endowatersipora endosymbiont of Watersipora subatra]|uniref:peptidoglycan-binding domain-containing protein n=1 Tax=Candidatus Endowatersipora endosymbiont of Watersipora subatra TaxID=3077946 RepID=UPI00312C7518
MIFSNALLFQSERHPSPLFVTRNAHFLKTRSEHKHTSTIRDRLISHEICLEQESTKKLMREIQSELLVRGYYIGTIDGLYGSRTQKAILTFQDDNDLNQDGKASIRLLKQILLSPSSLPHVVTIPKPRKLLVTKTTLEKSKRNDQEGYQMPSR